MRVIFGEGATGDDCKLFICGERPGFVENETGRAFVGPAGEELWHRLWRATGLTRDDCYVTNLVPTFSVHPPSPSEVKHWEWHLRAELLKVKPTLICTVGYHAARWFLPQFGGVNGDYFHGLPFGYQYGRLTVRQATVLPVVHTSAALRQPDRYQNQLSSDLGNLAALVESGPPYHQHRLRRVVPYRVGLAGFSRDGQTVGIDTEYANGIVQCVTLSPASSSPHDKNDCCLLELNDNKRPQFLRPAILNARRLISHSAGAEWHALRSLGIDLTDGPRLDDTMLKAYLLNLPQSLKVLAFRILGWEMDEYSDLVGPLDERLVRQTLEEAHRGKEKDVEEGDARRAARIVRAREAGAALRRNQGTSRVRPAQREEAKAATALARSYTDDEKRARKVESSLRRFLHTRADEPLRKRWERSVFQDEVALPPAPSWKDLPAGVRHTYAMTDAIGHRCLDAALDPQLDAQHLRQAYEIDRAALPMLFRNEEVGLAVDVDGLRRLSVQFAKRYDYVCRKLERLCGHPVNPNAPEQVGETLFNELGVRATRKTPSGKHYTTQDKYLKARRPEHDAVGLVIKGRQLTKYRSTYTERLPALLRNGRYHPNWKYTRTATGRLAEEIILLIPKHTADGRRIRDCFHASAGHFLVSVDLSQIELRSMAHLSRDARLLRAFAEGWDFHADVAHRLLAAPKRKEDQDESLHRLPAKTINFGIINGMTEYGLLDQLHEAGQLHWTIEAVAELLRDWFKVYAGVDHYWKMQIAKAKRLGYVTDLFGARRWIAAVHSRDDRIRRGAERQCLCPIQMTADRISKIWNKRIWKRILLPAREKYYCEPWVRVHDDTTLEVEASYAANTAGDMLGLVPQLLDVPTLAEAKVGERWGSLHTIG